MAKHEFIYPKVRIDKGIITDKLHDLHTLHVKCQTLLRKEHEGKYYEQHFIIYRKAKLDNSIDGDKNIYRVVTECLTDLHTEVYVAIASGKINPLLRSEENGELIFPEWSMHPHSLSEDERIRYLRNAGLI